MNRSIAACLVMACMTPVPLSSAEPGNGSQPPGQRPSLATPGRHYVFYPPGWPYYGGAYPYSPYGYWHDPYPHYYYPYPPPIFIPGETMFGPESVKRFMGVDHWFQAQPRVSGARSRSNRVARADAPRGDVARAPAERKPAVGEPNPKNEAPAGKNDVRDRPPNPAAMGLAWKFIGFGDVHFGNQKYTDAYDRYRKAARAAPQLADVWFRQGLVQVAMQRYDLAAASIKRGLELNADWPSSDFHLKELYGVNELTKKSHVDALAAAAEVDPNNADLLFLLGVHLYFDGARDRAMPFFQRAAQMAQDKTHLEPFLKAGG